MQSLKQKRYSLSTDLPKHKTEHWVQQDHQTVGQIKKIYNSL